MQSKFLENVTSRPMTLFEKISHMNTWTKNIIAHADEIPEKIGVSRKNGIAFLAVHAIFPIIMVLMAGHESKMATVILGAMWVMACNAAWRLTMSVMNDASTAMMVMFCSLVALVWFSNSITNQKIPLRDIDDTQVANLYNTPLHATIQLAPIVRSLPRFALVTYIMHMFNRACGQNLTMNSYTVEMCVTGIFMAIWSLVAFENSLMLTVTAPFVWYIICIAVTNGDIKTIQNFKLEENYAPEDYKKDIFYRIMQRALLGNALIYALWLLRDYQTDKDYTLVTNVYNTSTPIVVACITIFKHISSIIANITKITFNVGIFVTGSIAASTYNTVTDMVVYNATSVFNTSQTTI